MAAYAALVSLTHIIQQVKLYHVQHSIFTHEQKKQVGLLHEKASFLQDFLERRSPEASAKESAESWILDAANKAEDIIETYIVDDIHHRSTGRGRRNGDRFSRGLHKVIDDMDSIGTAVTKIKDKDQLSRNIVDHADALRPLPTGKDTTMVFGDDLNQIMDKLTRHQSDSLIIPITGMGGIGKTTLARTVYENLLIVQYFDFRCWITISQEYDVQEMFVSLLECLSDERPKTGLDYHQLGEIIYNKLFGARYLIVMDDMWSVEAWDKLKLYLPDNSNGSRIMLTTRLLNVANDVGSRDVYKMNLLDEDESWHLLCRKIFVQESCPPELEGFGKEIAKNCKGLPLSIAVMGGLIAKSNMSREYWEYVSRETRMMLNSADNERCYKILYMSYNHLPVHLKPCFLYMGVFGEDQEIRVSRLIKLWVAEGFLKPNETKSIEEVAKECLKDLIERNLIFISKLGCTGNVKFCKIHDNVRDLCLREAQKERFLCIIQNSVHGISQEVNSQRLIVTRSSLSDEKHIPPFSHALQTSFPRSLIYTSYFDWGFRSKNSVLAIILLHNTRLLRVLDVSDPPALEVIFELVNSRYISLSEVSGNISFPSSVYMLWNLHSLLISGDIRETVLPSAIWEMPQLRHLMLGHASLPDPPRARMNRQGYVVLENLQTLTHVSGFRCTEDVLQRIPCMRKLRLCYDRTYKDLLHCRLDNLGRLGKLQSLQYWSPYGADVKSKIFFFASLSFPLLLKKLTLGHVLFDWKDLSTKIGSLPHLEKLKLSRCWGGKVWNTVEGKFLSLKSLQMIWFNLECWITDDTHFPRLEHLFLEGMDRLKEIPSCLGDITTFQLIELKGCTKSVVVSAKNMLEEQRSMGNESLCLLVKNNFYNNNGE